MVAGRVTLAHLHQAGLLAEGAQLVFEHAGTRHLARVKRGGWLELPDGQQFRFPTPAAVAAAGQGRFDGWQEWRSEDGTTLDRLRQRYLNDPVTGVASAAVLDVARTDERHRKLRAARERAMSGKPLALTVEELIGWWGRRGSLASEQVSSDLANYGLVTYPDFDAVPQHVTVELISERQYIDARRDVEGPSRGAQVQVVEESPTAAGEEVAPVVGMTVGRLRSALAGVVSVHPSASFEDAITKMVINDYSQLPVLANERQLRGAVTWKSIARARHANHAPSFSQAIGSARDVAYNQDLVDVLPILAEQDFVFVRDQTERIAGIVTASDLAAEYGATATPFFLIGELDQRLRRIIAATYDFAVVRALCDPEGARGIATFDDLSIGDYQRVLENKDCWDELAWPLNRKVFVERLDQLREIRNDLMHFNPGSRPDDDVQKIRNMINLLREYGG
ncbi:MAG: CBS domain-containing protein [Saccharothrix sp.]|nr:CBS domain-containing protein [Saccharothrix sp.]